jgi:hypothetical protein
VANKELVLAIAGLAGLMLAEVPQVLSGFLPSPSTAYDKASGAIDTGPDSAKVLRRSLVKGSAISILMAGAVSAFAYIVVGWKAIWLFLLAMAVLGLFLQDFLQAQKLGAQHANGGT